MMNWLKTLLLLILLDLLKKQINDKINDKINEIKGEIPGITGLATTSALNYIKKDTQCFSQTNKFDAKIKDNEDEYFNKCDYNKFTNQIHEERMKTKISY